MLKFGQKDLSYAGQTAAQWKSEVLERFLLSNPVTLDYDTLPTDGSVPPLRAFGNIRPAKLFDLFSEVFAVELPQIELRSLQDRNSTLLGKTSFTYAYPDALMENVYPTPGIAPQRLVDNYITYRLKEPMSSLQGLTGPIFQGNHEQRPRVRESIKDTDGNTYEIHGQRHIYELHLEVWAPGNKKADYLVDWVEDVIAMYGGWMISKGVQDLVYGWREMTGFEAMPKSPTGRIFQRELVYLVVLDRQYIIKKPVITAIEVGRELTNS